MKGLTIKEVLRHYGHTQQEVANLLGMSTQNFSAALAKEDVKSGLIERIAAVTGLPIAVFYGDTSAAPVAPRPESPSGGGDAVAALREQVQELIQQNGILLRLVERFAPNK